GYGPQHLQHAHGVNGARGARYPDNQPAFAGHARAPASFSTLPSSPLSYISAMMSEPPRNSPATYSWGMVGQLEYSLMPWRTSSSSSTLTVTSLVTPQACNT